MPELPDSEIRADAAADVDASVVSDALEYGATEVESSETGVESIADDAESSETGTETIPAPDALVADEPAEVFEPDQVLLDAVDLARRALLETTAPETVGSVIGHIAEGEHVLTLHFASDLSGYPGWHWSVTLVRVDDAEPTIVETQLMPGDGALLAPAWIPWSERLADYRAAQAAAAEAAREAGDDEHGDDLDDASEELEIVADDEFDDDDDDDDGAGDDGDGESDASDHDAHRDAFDGIDFEELDEGSLDDAHHDDVRLDESSLAAEEPAGAEDGDADSAGRHDDED
ncbi:DUF3027 domain-containing protein [Agromyces sp. Marseille-Q5079]|uniref:DUF3027 domain-containing protein n=1 Tax=Agromyces sp. Marseille-Q5079 TaxID=3439059 RepID=UPI003D9C962F